MLENFSSGELQSASSSTVALHFQQPHFHAPETRTLQNFRSEIQGVVTNPKLDQITEHLSNAVG
jgi:hypothetical protein